MMNKKCSNCGKEFLLEWKFCPECGKNLDSILTSKIRELADNGDCEAQFRLACRYDFGDGENKNPKEAVKWYKKSAKAGYAEAQFNLACYYLDCEGESNREEAIKWFRKAAEQGMIKAKYNLAYLLLKNVTMQDNVKTYALKVVNEAIKFLREAAEEGDAYSQDLLGLHYANGDFVEKNEEEAKRLFEAAAKQGYSYAQNHLGHWYFNEGKYFDAMWWYRHAAEQGHVDAQYNMAVCYYMSIEVLSKSKIAEVKRLYEIAMNNGAEDVSNLKDVIEENEFVEDDE